MAAVAVTYNLDQPDRVHLGGDNWLISGEMTLDTGDYASGGFAVAASSLSATTVVRLLVGKPSIIRTSAYWIKSTGKVKVFIEDGTTGIEAEHPASALTAQSIPFVAFVKHAA